MKPADNIKKFFRNAAIDTNPKMDQTVFDEVLTANKKMIETQSAKFKPSVWRIIMKSSITKLAAAAMIIIAAAFGLHIIFSKSVTPAYAIEQTLKANEDIKYLYFKRYDPNVGLSEEAWIQYDQNDNIQKIRADMYNWAGRGDVVEVWNKGKTLVWFKKHSRLDLFDCNEWTAKMMRFAEGHDPKRAVGHLYKMQQEGKVKIEIKEGSNGEPIRMTGQYLPGTYLIGRPDFPAYNDVLVIDPETKLVTQIEVYKGGQDQKYVCVYKDYDYQPFDPNIFDIEKQVPENVERFNGSTFGLEQDNLTDNEIAVKVVREYLDAWINKDYAKAGNLNNGMSSAEMQKRLIEKGNLARIISMGEPAPYSKPNGIRVPCVIEVEKDSGIEQQEQWFSISRNTCSADRWVIISQSRRNPEEIGLARGGLTDNEIAVKVVREFLEALVVKDYAKAAQMLGVESVADVERGWNKINYTQIISIGEPNSSNATNSICVPYTVEIEENGEVKQIDRHFFVNQHSSYYGRWIIVGGWKADGCGGCQ
jgi:hypothetical protein